MVVEIEKTNVPRDNIIYQRIERVLEGKSDKIKAKVWYLIKQKDIDPDDEFLLVFIALGNLEVLIEEAPKEWQNALLLYKDEFSSILGQYRQIIHQNNEKLEAWSQNNLNILGSIAKKVETMENLATSSVELSKSAGELVVVCSDLSAKLGTSSSESGKSLVKLKELKDNFENAIEKLPKLPESISTSLEEKLNLLTDKILVGKNRFNWKNNLPAIGAASISFLSLLAIWGMNNSFANQINTLKQGMEELASRQANYAEATNEKIESISSEINDRLATIPSQNSTNRSYYGDRQNRKAHVQSLFLEAYRECLNNPGIARECKTIVKD